ncbi:DNA recombination protein RmuC [Spiroplasma endosymbiont of Nebria brevicollis]|uniref:DNA recombination protein RmuC n=1 Tax=Spiroplasma endosymbiont of Nebria brevicollis TaxID=3066284 RepID=UPI003CC79C66
MIPDFCYTPEIFDVSFRERVWICSPTTLAYSFHIISQIQKDYELNKNISKVKKVINEIKDDY